MIGLDTNVLVRYFAQDDPRQSPVATQLMQGLTEDDPGFVSIIAIAELFWVLRRAYSLPKRDADAVIRRLLEAREIVVQDSAVVHRALATSARSPKTELPDALIAEFGRRSTCASTVTLDQDCSDLDDMSVLTP